MVFQYIHYEIYLKQYKIYVIVSWRLKLLICLFLNCVKNKCERPFEKITNPKFEATVFLSAVYIKAPFPIVDLLLFFLLSLSRVKTITLLKKINRLAVISPLQNKLYAS